MDINKAKIELNRKLEIELNNGLRAMCKKAIQDKC